MTSTTLAVDVLRRPRWRGVTDVVTGTVRRHWVFALVLLGGAVLRWLVVAGYHPSFFYFGDSYAYHTGARTFIPDPARPFGYSFFLWLMHPLDKIWRLVVLQHLAGLGLGVGLYAFLLRRGVSRLAAAVALAPFLLNLRTVVLEHYVLSETLFTCLTASAAVVTCRRTRPGWVACAGSGALFTAAALTRSAGLAMLLLPLLYLLVRRVDWRALAAFVAVVMVGLGGYLSWYHDVHGTYSFGTYSGRLLYSRVATFVDCDRLRLTADERLLCPAEPLDRRRPPDLYLWGPDTANTKMQDRRYDKVFSSFARKAILAQPGDYARTVVVDTAIFMRPDGARVSRPGNTVARTDCLTALWQIPAPNERPPCSGYWVYGTMSRVTTGSEIYQHSGRLTGPLSFSRYTQVPVTVVGLAVLFALVLTLWPGRRPPLRRAADPLLWGGLALGLVVASVATSGLDPRYAVPSLPLALVAAALAWSGFRRRPDCAAPDIEGRARRGIL